MHFYTVNVFSNIESVSISHYTVYYIISISFELEFLNPAHIQQHKLLDLSLTKCALQMRIFYALYCLFLGREIRSL